jgi:hypothetical protein
MEVGVDETGDHDPPFERDDLRPRGSRPSDLGVRADRHDRPLVHEECLDVPASREDPTPGPQA